MPFSLRRNFNLKKEFIFNVTVNWTQTISAETYDAAVKMLKDFFDQEFGIELDNDEIQLMEDKKDGPTN